jgi:L-ascorbate metabolism protein UlaG (beta-lactamase superfamily)
MKTIMEMPTDEIASIKLLSHACVKITVAKTVILTDPWFFGRVFNNGWGLSPEPSLDDLKKRSRGCNSYLDIARTPGSFTFSVVKIFM